MPRSSVGLGGTGPENTTLKFSTLVAYITSSNLLIPDKKCVSPLTDVLIL